MSNARAGAQRTPPSAAPAAVATPMQRALRRDESSASASTFGGRPLDAGVRAALEPRFGRDFSRVRVHADAAAASTARGLGAQAWTQGQDVSFAAGAYAPGSAAGRELLAHELAHVVQQAGGSAPDIERRPAATSGPELEAQADHAAAAALHGGAMPALAAAAPGVQRRVELRDVGRREAHGLPRLGELIDRLNGLSQGLTYAADAGVLTYVVREGGTLSNFDRQMMGFIDSTAALPMRLTTSAARIRDTTDAFNNRVAVDDWSSGYVDIDDLLASSDLGLQQGLVHFLQERASTTNYARRIGSANMDSRQAAVQPEFNRAHAAGLRAEVELLRDFFADPTIRAVPGAESGTIARVFTNQRRDSIRTRLRERRQVDALSVEVRLRADGRILTPEAYRDLLRDERAAAAAAAAMPAAVPATAPAP